jgi:pyridoxamine 5'-phosphate oxidase family protein
MIATCEDLAMSMFSEKEQAYLAGQRLGRMATVNRAGQPHVVPVAYRFNAELDAVEIGGHGFGTSKKFRDARATGKIAFVVDDVGPDGRARFIELRGDAEVLLTGGEQMRDGVDPQMIRVRPTRIFAWGIDGTEFGAHARDAGAPPPA